MFFPLPTFHRNSHRALGLLNLWRIIPENFCLDYPFHPIPWVEVQLLLKKAFCFTRAAFQPVFFLFLWRLCWVKIYTVPTHFLSRFPLPFFPPVGTLSFFSDWWRKDTNFLISPHIVTPPPQRAEASFNLSPTFENNHPPWYWQRRPDLLTPPKKKFWSRWSFRGEFFALSFWLWFSPRFFFQSHSLRSPHPAGLHSHL